MELMYELKSSRDASLSLRQIGAELLSKQWPEVPMPVRLRQLQEACSYLFLCYYSNITAPSAVGHVNISSCPATDSNIRNPESALGGACTFTSFIIHPDQRGKGLGLKLLQFAEKKAIERGFFYAYVWCREELVPFYVRGGYQHCTRLAHRPCLTRFSASQLNVLETLIARNATRSGRKVNEWSCWLHKRLVKATSPIHQKRQKIQAAIESTLKTIAPLRCWQVFDHLIPWQPQIGPSCGLVALSMAAVYFNDKIDGTQLVAELFDKALALGYSHDGEIFDIDHLAALAHESICGLHAEIKFLKDEAVTKILYSDHNKLIVFPYDRDNNGSPCLRGGAAAHYGLTFGIARQLQTDCVSSIKSHAGFSCQFSNNDSIETSKTRPHTFAKSVLSQNNHEPIVLFREGLSPRPIATTWQAVQDSNAQITQAREISYNKVHSDQNISSKKLRLAGRGLVLSRRL